MHVEHISPILNVSDMAASFAWFENLGWAKKWDWGDPPTFGAVGSGKVEIFLCLNGQGAGGVWMSWWVKSPAEVDRVHALAIEKGLTVTHPPTNEPWGVREFHLRHPDGHTFRVSAGVDCV